MVFSGVAVSILEFPNTVINVENTESALSYARAFISDIYVASSSPLKFHTSTSSYSIFSSVESIQEKDDRSLAQASIAVTWKDPRGNNRSLELTSLLQGEHDRSNSCDSFIDTDWTHPVVKASYYLAPGFALPSTLSQAVFEVGSLASTPHSLIVGISSSTSSNTPTVLFFETHGTSPSLTYVGGFDAASSSKIGVSGLATHNEFVFVGNGFGSKSPQTCADGISCAQIQTILAPAQSSPTLVSTLSLPSSSPPFAVTSTGESAPVAAVTYYDERLYIGLQKTARGSEFLIFDARTPSSLKPLGFLSIGRTVANITVRGDVAYLSTDDPSAELMVVSIADPLNPHVIGVYNAPGASGFGYGTVTTVRENIIRFGRSYSPNGPELQLLTTHSLPQITSIKDSDNGVSKDPESVRGLLQMDTLMFSLLTHRLEFWNTENNSLIPYAPAYQLPTNSNGAAIACRGPLLYLARNTPAGAFIDVLSGS